MFGHQSWLEAPYAAAERRAADLEQWVESGGAAEWLGYEPAEDEDLGDAFDEWLESMQEADAEAQAEAARDAAYDRW